MLNIYYFKPFLINNFNFSQLVNNFDSLPDLEELQTKLSAYYAKMPVVKKLVFILWNLRTIDSLLFY